MELTPSLALLIPSERIISLIAPPPTGLDGLLTDDLLGCKPGDYPLDEATQKAADAMLEATRVDQL